MLSFFPSVFFLAVFAPVDLLSGIGQHKDVIQLLLDGSDAAGIVAFGDVLDLQRERQALFVHDLVVLDDVDRNVVVDEAEGVQIDFIDGTFDLDDIFLAHLVAAGVFDDGDATVEFIQIQIVIDLHASAGLDMVQHEAFMKYTDI